MATFTRKNAWNQGGTFNNSDLLWYAKGVGVMQSRPVSDPTSWWFFAAMHGQTLTKSIRGTHNWRDVPAPPAVSITPLPSKILIDQYWDQCQHGTWYFLPWHRGYLFAIENILREIVQGLGGPGDWALPYWNYFGPGLQFNLPPSFIQQALPDGSPNPLLVRARYGASIPVSSLEINQECQRLNVFKGVLPDFYGGGDTNGFSHNSGQPGAIEYNPHGGVHVEIGGQRLGIGGLMSKPATAALDPIFYLHHNNLDRMWAAWNNAGNNNPTDANWLNGPMAQGDRKFLMPKSDKTPWSFTPAMVDDISKLNYTYEDLLKEDAVLALNKNARRLRNFGFSRDNIILVEKMGGDKDSELVGANLGVITVTADGARTSIQLDSKGWNKVSNSVADTLKARFSEKPITTRLPDQVILQFEGIKGIEDSIICSVSVNQQFVGQMYLFGLSEASLEDGNHGGAGLTIRFDISSIVDELQFNKNIDLNSLDVLIQPKNIVSEGNELSIDRVSIYRQSQI